MRTKPDGTPLSSNQAGMEDGPRPVDVPDGPRPVPAEPLHQPTTWFQRQREADRRLDITEGHEILQGPTGKVPVIPPQPSNSPWTKDLVPDEPLIQGESLTVGESLSGNPLDRNTPLLPSGATDLGNE
jgi:hypothetical protein